MPSGPNWVFPVQNPDDSDSPAAKAEQPITLPSSSHVGDDDKSGISTPELGPGQYWLLQPGEHAQVADHLPHHVLTTSSIRVLANRDELVFDTPWHRTRCDVPSSTADRHGRHHAKRVVLVLVHQRPIGHLGELVRRLFALDDDGHVVARLDDTDHWEMCPDCLERICSVTGLAFEIARFETEAELIQRHPDWANPIYELAIEHPREEEIREFGLAFWIGALIAGGLAGASGMALIYATPVSFVVDLLAALGLFVALTLTLWARLKWWRRQKMGANHLRRSP